MPLEETSRKFAANKVLGKGLSVEGNAVLIALSIGNVSTCLGPDKPLDRRCHHGSVSAFKGGKPANKI